MMMMINMPRWNVWKVAVSVALVAASGNGFLIGVPNIDQRLCQPSWKEATPRTIGQAGTRDESDTTLTDIDDNDAASNSVDSNDEIREGLLEDLSALAFCTSRGFNATQSERNQVQRIISELTKYNPTAEPVAAYYSDTTTKALSSSSSNAVSSLAGKWTLIYTDAPDIISLEGSRNSLAVLGRIGQECDPPYIRNVIEWRRPSWADFLPFSGTEQARILQKVVTRAQASPQRPSVVQLDLVGLELESPNDEGSSSLDTDRTLSTQLQQRGLLPTLLNQAPIQMQGPLTAPFGEFEVLYLDSQIRIIRTGQNYIAVNRRIIPIEDAWF